MDVFSSAITGLEAHNSKTACNAWSFQVGQSRQILENFYAFSPIGARIVDKEPQDALRFGYTIESEEIDEVAQRDIASWNRRRQFLSKFAQARKWERLFGGALLFMHIDDGREAWEPVDTLNIRTVGQLTVLSRYDVNVSQFHNSPVTGELAVPAFYNLNFGGGKLHPSRCIVFGGITLTVEQMVNNGGFGAGVIDRAWLELERYMTTQSYLAEAVTRITQGVFSTPTLTAAGSADCQQQALMEQRLTQLGQWIGVLGDIVVGEGESYDIKQRGLQGFKDAAEIFVDALTGATDIPKSILFGLTPGGLNSGDNSGDWQSWTSHLSGVQTDVYDPRINQYQTLAFQAGNSPLAFIPEAWDIAWPALYEQTEIDKSTVLANTANAAVSLATQGLISDNEARSNEAIQAAFPAQEDTKIAETANNAGLVETEETSNAKALASVAGEFGGDPEEVVEAVAGDVQGSALNGAQIAGMADIVTKVSTGEYSVETGVLFAKIAFPQADETQVRELMRAASNSKGPALEVVSGK